MKTWNEIEAQLKSEGGAEPSAKLHDNILRAVRDDRAAANLAEAPRHHTGIWLLAAGAVAAALVVAVLPQRPLPRPAAPPPDTGAIFSLASLEAAATSPMENELQNIRSDLDSAATFIANCLPGDRSGS